MITRLNIEIIDTCGDNRNSYSKTDKDTFMHLKRLYEEWPIKTSI